MITAIEIWNGTTTNERTELIDKYGRSEMMPYYWRKPSDEQIISVLTKAKIDGYLLTTFKEFLNPSL